VIHGKSPPRFDSREQNPVADIPISFLNLYEKMKVEWPFRRAACPFERLFRER
jgi:hypothetical protein